MSEAHSYDCLWQVMSYDTLRVVMMCLRHSLKLKGNHIITLAKQAHNIWRSQIHNSKLITYTFPSAKRVISYDCLRQVMIGFAKFEVTGVKNG